MGEELTGVTLGGFGGRSPPFSLPLPLLPSSLPLLLLGLSLPLRLPPLALGSSSCGGDGGRRGKNSAWCFSEQVPPAATPNNGNYRHHLRLKQASLGPGGCVEGGLRGGEGRGGGWPDNEAASDHPEYRPATNEQHSRLKAFIKIIHYSKKRKNGRYIRPPPHWPHPYPRLPAVISSKGVLKYTSS